jgi:hypothetical protein
LLCREFDGFSVFLGKPGGGSRYSSSSIGGQKKFVSRIKPPRTILEETDLVLGETYEVSVQTLSGKVTSNRASTNFTFLPNPNLPTLFSYEQQEQPPPGDEASEEPEDDDDDNDDHKLSAII